jgi:hypothetical protein
LWEQKQVLFVFSEEARSFSPLLLDVTSLAVTKLRILVAVGEHDSPEFQRQSCEFAEVRRTVWYDNYR